jgi:hypothetical protein
MVKRSGPSSEARFAAYVEALTGVIGHANRAAPLRASCTGLVLPVITGGERQTGAEESPIRVAPRLRQCEAAMGPS